ncbi:hypothetical protein G647_01358 [Cladophialophora carrionii CBS 160.54]|uniref:FHA domain-containing protein n=1 Tax=Cladophialophora carrionii CBS 160.54 TaxID=1279043 RepID=V9DQJ5_9EURO|nr:uncharacterized protein G647_01358 [Cladophialophora carrionii CBS 160.54]ETI28906.1 hypothetical protein G647_01358 [Cladophialophora carrionii CBS 160.54]
MWILDSNADFMQGKRMWLKPGQRYLFGRVKKDGVMLAIDHKTVSRQHFTISVDPVKEGDVGNILARTKIRVEDHSKTGTFVNGEPLKKKDPKNEAEPNPSTELKRAENSIRPGTCPYEFTLTWQPCVLTFNLLKKEIKAGVLKDKQARVRNYDIKGVSEFSNHTTHVVAAKRNTPKGLQALVNGKHLVTEAYLDALDYATTPTTLSQDVNLSPLEIDFDVNWPDPKDYLPLPGKEPTVKPPEAYQPDSARASVFEHYTFVFCDQNQYDNLMPVVTDGHGKALVFKVVNAETTGDDLLQFVQNVAGRKYGDTQIGPSKGGVVLVRPSIKDDALQEWTNKIMNETVLKMDQRAIDQSEFLEAILSNDAGVLKETVPFESTNDSIIAPAPTAANSLVSLTPTSVRTNGVPGSQISDISGAPRADTPLATNEGASAAQNPQTSAQNNSQNSPPTEPAPRPFSMPKISQATKFKNFDDGFDPDAVDDYVDDEVVEEEEPNDPQAPRTQPGMQTQVSHIKQEPVSTAKKRRRSLTEESADVFANQIDDLLPAATGLKRLKLAEAAANGRLDVEEPQPQKSSVKKIKKEKVIDVREAVRKRLEEEEARKDDSHLSLPDVEDRAPANLVQVVTLDLPVRDKSKTKDRENGEYGSEWDPKWNGRKNFKGFRRKGDPPQRRTHARKVIVPLEQVPIKSGGLGDQYWPRSEEDREVERQRRRKEEARSQRTTQSETQQLSGNSGGRSKARVVLDDDDEEDMDASGGEDGQDRVIAQTSPATSRLQREAAEIAEHEIDPTVPRRTRAADRTQGTSANGSDTEGGDPTQRRIGVRTGKRPASSIADTSKPKRQKTLPVTSVRDDDSDDDDDMKFRFGTRARRGRGRGRGRGGRA